MRVIFGQTSAVLFILASSVSAQNASRDDRIKPEQLGLPKETKRTSEPFVTRIYKSDAAGTILMDQPKGYPSPRPSALPP